MNIKKIALLLYILTITPLYGREEGDAERIPEGNLALPTSQEPGPLFGFGETLVDKGDFLFYICPYHLNAGIKGTSIFIPSFVYGISETLALTLAFPAVKKMQMETVEERSSGMGDVAAQLEYAFYNYDKPHYANQATVVTSLTLPTGSASKVPPTGFGAPSVFVGMTFSHLSINWYAAASTGLQIPFKHHTTKFGNLFFYECGIGRNIAYRTDKWICTAILEFLGEYGKRDKLEGEIDQNSGGNAIYIAPTLWFSTKKLIIQAGIAFPITQHWFGVQPKEKYLGQVCIGWKFN